MGAFERGPAVPAIRPNHCGLIEWQLFHNLVNYPRMIGRLVFQTNRFHQIVGWPFHSRLGMTFDHALGLILLAGVTLSSCFVVTELRLSYRQPGLQAWYPADNHPEAERLIYARYTLGLCMDVSVWERRVRNEPMLSEMTILNLEAQNLIVASARKQRQCSSEVTWARVEVWLRASSIQLQVMATYAAEARSPDSAKESLTTDQRVFMITSSYEAQLLGNARCLVEWVESLHESALHGISHAVFGCGNYESSSGMLYST